MFLSSGVLAEPSVNSKKADTTIIDKSAIKPFDDLKEENIFQKEKSTPFSTGVTKEEHDKIPKGPKFHVEKFEFWGNSVVSEGKLSEFANGLAGTDIYYSDLKKLCDKITKYYHDEGYVTSKAYIPAQRVKNGVVEIALQEGRYGNISIEGNKWSDKEYLESILSSNGVKTDDVLNVYELDLALKEIRNHNYMQGKISVNKSKYSDFMDIKVKIKDRFPLDFKAGWHNEGQEFTGEQLALINASYNNITGKGDSASLGAMLSTGVIGAFTSYSEPLDEKTRITASYSYTNSSFGGIFDEFDIFGNTHTYSATINRKLHRGKKWMVDADVGLEARNSQTEIGLFDLPINEYRMRTLVTGITARKKDSTGMWITRAEARTGLPVCNATEISEDYGYADSKYIKADLKLRRYQRLPFGLMGVFKTDAQYSPNKLLVPEKMYLGGSNTVRGFDPLKLIGDSGFNSSVEIRKELPFIDNLLPAKLKHLEGRFQVGCFYDCGYVRDINMSYEPLHTNFLQSTGVTFYVPLTKYITANLNVGIPVGGKLGENQDVRFSFNLATDIHNLWAKNIQENL